MREHLDALSRALKVAHREQNAPRASRSVQPRGARATYKPVRDESMLRGFAA